MTFTLFDIYQHYKEHFRAYLPLDGKYYPKVSAYPDLLHTVDRYYQTFHFYHTKPHARWFSKGRKDHEDRYTHSALKNIATRFHPSYNLDLTWMYAVYGGIEKLALYKHYNPAGLYLFEAFLIVEDAFFPAEATEGLSWFSLATKQNRGWRAIKNFRRLPTARHPPCPK